MRAAALLATTLLVLGTTTAHADPVLRLGLTFAVADQGAPEQHQVGPMIGLGIPFGRFVVEADYALLSFMEPDVVGGGGMHRFGVNVRAALFRNTSPCFIGVGCLRGVGGYVEVGAALRHGQWHLDANTMAPASSNQQREAHVGVGLELDNRVIRWHLGFRLAAAARDDLLVACRGTGCPGGALPGKTGATDLSALVEWMFIFGR